MNCSVQHIRKSYIRQGEIYFWTATINKWQHLLRTDEFKNVIMNSYTAHEFKKLNNIKDEVELSNFEVSASNNL